MILAANATAGVAYRLNVKTGKAVVVIDDPTMKPTKGNNISVNGLKVHNRHLYFKIGAQGIFVGITIHINGTPRGRAVVLARHRGSRRLHSQPCR